MVRVSCRAAQAAPTWALVPEMATVQGTSLTIRR